MKGLSYYRCFDSVVIKKVDRFRSVNTPSSESFDADIVINRYYKDHQGERYVLEKNRFGDRLVPFTRKELLYYLSCIESLLN